MSTINDGGPAFPHEYKYGDGTAARADGMTLRDYFAAKAMQGFCAGAQAGDDIEVVPALCYQMADAMLKAREVKP